MPSQFEIDAARDVSRSLGRIAKSLERIADELEGSRRDRLQLIEEAMDFAIQPYIDEMSHLLNQGKRKVKDEAEVKS